MHFAILDIEENSDEHGSYTSYVISINGGYHSSIRYKQLREVHEQLKKDFGERVPDKFPPKKLLTLNQVQCEERRELLEKYLQAISQDKVLISSKIFVRFLLKAQKESLKVEEKDTKLDIYLMNGKKFQVNIRNTDSTDHVMQEAMSQIKLPKGMIHYFSLSLVQKEEDNITIVRKLQGFESPALVLLAVKDEHRLVIRKNFWASSIEDELYKDKIALNLLFVQAVSDIERDWVLTTPETLEKLEALKIKNDRKKYLMLARSQKFYGYLQFKSCEIDFPESNSRVILSVGGYELNCRIIGTQKTEVKEGSFKVTRIKCWRVVSSKSSTKEVVTKIAFEYLFSKDKLQWITITSEQAMLISVCLQGMVDEIVQRKSKMPEVPAPSKKCTKEESSRGKEQTSTSSAVKTEISYEKKQESRSSDEDSPAEKRRDKQQEQSSSEKRSSKKNKKQKKIVSVKNEVFAHDIQDEDL